MGERKSELREAGAAGRSERTSPTAPGYRGADRPRVKPGSADRPRVQDLLLRVVEVLQLEHEEILQRLEFHGCALRWVGSSASSRASRATRATRASRATRATGAGG